MRKGKTVVEAPAKNSAVDRLVAIFPDASPVRVPVLVVASRKEGRDLKENTTIEFGTSRIVLFFSKLPLELDDKIFLRNSDGSLGIEANVIALQYEEGHRAIAARFLTEDRNWIIKN
ncbi:MAG TPA: hypothetical protein VIH72_05000 [Candidatus Acidoferrales bacterium]|jgi:hypothetical protein